MHYVVDIDIRGFFDNVNHGKLIKQMWSLGIQDKQLLCIISKMLKAPIEGIGTPIKGTPQGGILSPLLSNIVLNELDWWIAGQWEKFETRHKYSTTHKYRALKENSNLKEMFIVRYADDFKIFCRDYKTANKVFKAIKMWLKERLHLDISPEKSKVVNLKTNYSEFLGFKMKTVNKSGKSVAITHVSDKAMKRMSKELTEQIKVIKKNTTTTNVSKFNSKVLGMHNYYKIATHVNLDFHKIAYIVNKNLYNKLRKVSSNTGTKSKCFEKFYGHYNYKIMYIGKIALFPVAGIKSKSPMSFSQEICNYTCEGRILVHNKLQGIDMKIIKYLLNNPIPTESIEYNDNRLSLYVGQKGLCAITGKLLEIGDFECHHKKTRENGGKDDYSNLTLVKTDVHKLIHATQPITIDKYKQILQLEDKAIKKINKLRILAGNTEI